MKLKALRSFGDYLKGDVFVSPFDEVATLNHLNARNVEKQADDAKLVRVERPKTTAEIENEKLKQEIEALKEANASLKTTHHEKELAKENKELTKANENLTEKTEQQKEKITDLKDHLKKEKKK